jgi:pentose-5-phosphate-3-epimerase
MITKRPETVMQTVRNGEQLGTFEPENSNAMKRIVDKVRIHGMTTQIDFEASLSAKHRRLLKINSANNSLGERLKKSKFRISFC